MAQAAYDFARFENASNSAAHQRSEKTKLHSVSGKKANTAILPSHATTAKRIVCALAAAVLLVMFLNSAVQLAELSQKIQNQQSQLSTEQSRYNYLMNSLNEQTSLSEIEVMAKETGLVKMDASQITYVRIDDEALVETTQTSTQAWAEIFRQGVQAVLVYFDP